MADKRDRGLIEWLSIVAEFRPLYAEFRAAQGDLTKVLGLVEKALGMLVARGVTLDEIAQIVTTVGPLLAVFKR